MIATTQPTRALAPAERQAEAEDERRWRLGPPPTMSDREARADRADVAMLWCPRCIVVQLQAEQYFSVQPWGYRLEGVCPVCGWVEEF